LPLGGIQEGVETSHHQIVKQERHEKEADMRISTIIKQIEKRRDAVGKERDKLDDLISELEELRNCCERAWDDLQTARDALSELA
jgi:chromosome segregation ATPase